MEAEAIRCWLGHMSTLLAAIVRDAEQTIGRIDILGVEERHHLVSIPAAVSRPGLDVVALHGLFEARVRETPDAEAVVAGEDRVTPRHLHAAGHPRAHTPRRQSRHRNHIAGLPPHPDTHAPNRHPATPKARLA